MADKKQDRLLSPPMRIGVTSVLVGSLLAQPIPAFATDGSATLKAADASAANAATCPAPGTMPINKEEKQVTPVTTVTFTGSGIGAPPTVQGKDASATFSFAGQSLHAGNYFFVESQDLPFTLPRKIVVKVKKSDGSTESVEVAKVERVSYHSDYYRAMDSNDPSRFDISADNAVIKRVKYKITFNERVEGLADLQFQVSRADKAQSIAFTRDTKAKFRFLVNDVVIKESEYTLPAWNSGGDTGFARNAGKPAPPILDNDKKPVYDSQGKQVFQDNDGTKPYMRANVMTYDARPIGDAEDISFMKDFKSQGVLVFNTEIGGIPGGFIAKISCKSTNPNPWTWAESNIVGAKLPVYFMPYDLEKKPQIGNSKDKSAFVADGTHYAMIESISDDRKTATVRFFGDYSKPGVLVMGTINPDKVPAGNMGTFGINFDNENWASGGAAGVFNDAQFTDMSGKPFPAYGDDTGIPTSYINPTYGANAQYGGGEDNRAVVATASNTPQVHKGEVLVRYVDTEGNEIKPQEVDTPATDGNICSPYDTVEDKRPGTIDFQNHNYKLVKKGSYTVGEVGDDGNLLTTGKAGLIAADNVLGTAPKGQVAQGTRYVTYVYELAEGSVTVNYVDVNGNVIQDPVKDVENAPVGSTYTTTDDRRDATITDKNGKVYKLVDAGKYPVGTVGAEHNLTSSKLKAVVGQDDPTGTAPNGNVVKGERFVTYVYQEVKGNVVVNYVDTEGNKIAEPVTDTENASYTTEYDTITDHRPAQITPKNGKLYRLASSGMYEVGKVGVDYNLVETTKPGLVAQNSANGGTPTGSVEKPLTEVTYVYKEVKGDVVVRYLDSDGNPLNGTGKFNGSDKTLNIESVKAADTLKSDDKDSDYTAAVKDTDTSSVGTPYDTAGNWPDTIESNGKVYDRVPSLTQGSPAGSVVEGTTVVTYVYKERVIPQVTGNVVVHYVDVDGNEISTPVYDTTGAAVDTDYTTTDYKSDTITHKGKLYRRVATAGPTAGAGTVDATGLLVTPKAGAQGYLASPAAETGKVVDGTLDVTYVYEEVKGDVAVHYVDVKGNPLPGTGSGYDGTDATQTIGTLPGDQTLDPNDADFPAGVKDTDASSVGTAYDTADKRPNRITTADGKVYQLVPVLTKGAESGKVVEGTTVITYMYEQVKGSVDVSYIDTEGTMLQPNKDAAKDQPVGDDYNGATPELRPERITTADGKVYQLVKKAATYPSDKVGKVDDQGHRVESAATTGKVTEQPQTITYVYEQVKGSVDVTYVDTEGKKITFVENGAEVAGQKNAATDQPVGENYDTVTDTLRPKKLTTPDGRVYELVEGGYFDAVGAVEKNGHQVSSDAVTGNVAEQRKTVTYVYRQVKSGVDVTYVDTEGKQIKDPAVAAEDASIGDAYNAEGKLKPEEITTPEGKVYQLVKKAGDYGVGAVDDKGHLTKSASPTGNVTAERQTVTYVYEQVRGNVTVEYKDVNGNVIKDPQDVAKDQPTGDAYDTATDALKPATIEHQGKKYRLVRAGSYPVGTVDGNSHLESSDPVAGKVAKDPQTVTYVYEEVKGDVLVHYVEQGTGKQIASDVIDTPKSSLGTEYDTAIDNKPQTIVYTDPDTGVKSFYELVGVKAGSAAETGTVVEGTTEVTYEYKLVEAPADPTGSVTVRYLDTEGNEISREVVDEKNVPIGTAYDTIVDNRPQKIVTSAGRTYKLVPAGTDYPVGAVDADGRLTSSDPATGAVEEGFKTVTYVYQEVKGSVIVHYRDTEGNPIADDVTDEKDKPTGTDYDTTDNRPDTIKHNGRIYKRVPKLTEGAETGKVVEGTTEVTYVYELVKGDVVVHYEDSEGNPIADDVIDEKDTPAGTAYDTTDNRPDTIEKNGKTYRRVPKLTRGSETGEVVEGTTEVTYVYELVKDPETPGDPEPGKPGDPTPGKPGDPKVTAPAKMPSTGDAGAVAVAGAGLGAALMGLLARIARRRTDES
ncbi:hypothetical protein HLV38_03380 [Berryella wangjianweii]|uniref:MucBP domain-containing protein n=1 Tax=Berryella wangjianweii TaxID=2734634 RepID=A0A6M8J6F8_9ACTN|nr:MucBP domain-containing protein [Berryella wangjianweii]QKF07268.1 hypothetical protein HLV38_03380 [Berryella wangjianweii]